MKILPTWTKCWNVNTAQGLSLAFYIIFKACGQRYAGSTATICNHSLRSLWSHWGFGLNWSLWEGVRYLPPKKIFSVPWRRNYTSDPKTITSSKNECEALYHRLWCLVWPGLRTHFVRCGGGAKTLTFLFAWFSVGVVGFCPSRVGTVKAVDWKWICKESVGTNKWFQYRWPRSTLSLRR